MKVKIIQEIKKDNLNLKKDIEELVAQRNKLERKIERITSTRWFRVWQKLVTYKKRILRLLK
jgi:hypothetical protein